MRVQAPASKRGMRSTHPFLRRGSERRAQLKRNTPSGRSLKNCKSLFTLFKYHTCCFLKHTRHAYLRNRQGEKRRIRSTCVLSILNSTKSDVVFHRKLAWHLRYCCSLPDFFHSAITPSRTCDNLGRGTVLGKG